MTGVDTAPQPTGLAGGPSSSRRWPSLDGLRAVGALAVLTTHVGFETGASLHGPLSNALARLDIGVAVFFVISGFLLYAPRVRPAGDARPQPPTGRYLTHRALRILPAYWVTVVAVWLLLPQSDHVAVGTWVRQLTLTQIYARGSEVLGLTQMWSLCTEVAFYLVLPLLAVALSGRRMRTQLAGLAVLGAVGPVWMFVVHTSGFPLAALWLPAHLDWFATGMLLAWWRTARRRGLVRRSVLDDLAAVPGTSWGAAVAVFVIASTPIAGPYSLAATTPAASAVKTTLYALIGLLVVLPCAVDGAPQTGLLGVLSSRPARWLGDVSYGVFCYHVLLLALVRRTLHHPTFGGRFFLVWTLTALASVAVATASFYWFERPLMLRGRRSEAGRSSPLRVTVAADSPAATPASDRATSA